MQDNIIALPALMYGSLMNTAQFFFIVLSCCMPAAMYGNPDRGSLRAHPEHEGQAETAAVTGHCGPRTDDRKLIEDALAHGPRPLRTADTATFVFIGDVMLHSAQLENAHGRHKELHGESSPDCDSAYDFTPYLEELKETISGADIAAANMEFALAGPPFSGYPSFSAPDSYAGYIRDCGADIFLTANNHICDKGASGMERTMSVYRHMEDSGQIHVTGCTGTQEAWPPEILFLRVRGIKTAFLNFTYGTNVPAAGKYRLNMLRKDKVRQALQKARDEGAEFIVALPHWGEEYHLKHSEAQEDMARWMAENGADVIIGTHPHVIQDCDTIMVRTADGEKHVPVIYSLGNIISNMSAANTQAGLLLRMTVVRNHDGSTAILPLELMYTWCSLPGRLTDSHKTIFLEDGLQRRREWQDSREWTKMKDTYHRLTEINAR